MSSLKSWHTAVPVLAVTLLPASTAAQSFPTKPVRILAAESGSGGDLIARMLAQGMAEPLGQPVIVDNRPSNLLGDVAAKALPDGYTLLIEGLSFWLAPLLQKMPYDVVRDFAPVTTVTVSPWMLVVHPGVSAKSVKELIDLAKSKPGDFNFASAGIGGGAHLAGELFKSMTGVNIVHVPFKGSGAAVIGMLGGQVQMLFGNPPAVVPHVKTGKLRALAVTSAQPTPLFPGMPTVASSGLPGYEVTVATALFAPARTPGAIVNRLNQDAVRVIQRPEIKDRLFSTGVEAVGNSSAELGATVKVQIEKWRKVITEAGIRLE